MEETVHLFFYVADEGGTLDLGKGISDIPNHHILASGSRYDLDSWQLHLESKVQRHSELKIFSGKDSIIFKI